MSILSAYMYVYHMYIPGSVHRGQKWVSRFPGTEITDSCEPSRGYA